jgi:hypothetical protein
MAQVAPGGYGAGMRSLFRIPRTGHQVLWLAIAWGVILFLLGSASVGVYRTVVAG